jgi:hypothetical protein
VLDHATAEDYIVDGEDAKAGEIKWQVRACNIYVDEMKLMRG